MGNKIKANPRFVGDDHNEKKKKWDAIEKPKTYVQCSRFTSASWTIVGRIVGGYTHPSPFPTSTRSGKRKLVRQRLLLLLNEAIFVCPAFRLRLDQFWRWVVPLSSGQSSVIFKRVIKRKLFTSRLFLIRRVRCLNKKY